MFTAMSKMQMYAVSGWSQVKGVCVLGVMCRDYKAIYATAELSGECDWTHAYITFFMYVYM